MSYIQCWRCLLRPPMRPVKLPSTQSSLRSSRRSFSTSSAAQALNKKPAQSASTRGTKTLRIKKKDVVKTGRPVAAGERKAYRKRVVLTNPNALQVQGMKELSVATLDEETCRGTVVALAGPVIDQLRAVDAFKPTQGWMMFRSPGVLIRNESEELWQMMKAMDGGRPSTYRRIFTGDRGSGKTVMLLQAMAMAFAKGWMVISIPEAQEITMDHTEYAPLAKSKPTQYVQKSYMAALLTRMLKANHALLSSLQVSKTHSLPIPLQDTISLARLAELGARDPDVAWPIFLALWAELTAPSTDSHTRPPILISIDGIAHLMRTSQYRAADFGEIHAHDLSLVQHLMRYLSGTNDLTNGGAILGATSKSNNPSAPTFYHRIEEMEQETLLSSSSSSSSSSSFSSSALSTKHGITPFTALDPRVLDSLRSTLVTTLPGLSHTEAKGLLQYYAASGILRARVDDPLVAERRALAGRGVVGELERGVLGLRI
ncbi:MAG: 37S ribosomal protein S23 mitochondrial [Thelocarpon superellum]|nr:MAG: 37S ribosomal protein S23 mitochondrial [Thelocarpon superellum]